MEHPFLVEEFTPERATQRAFTSANRFMTAEPQPSAALPPLPNLSASEALFLTPSSIRQLLRLRLQPARFLRNSEHAERCRCRSSRWYCRSM